MHDSADTLPTEVAAQRSENDRASVTSRSVRLRGGVGGLRLREKERLVSARSRETEEKRVMNNDNRNSKVD